MYTITEIYFKMKALLASLLLMILKIDPRPHFLWWTPGHNDCAKDWFTSTTPPNSTRFKGIIKAFSEMCVRLTSITFPVIWSIVLISATWVTLLWAGHVCLSGSENITSHDEMAPPSFTSSRFTLWHYGRLATQLSRSTLWHNGCRAKQHGLMHVPGVARISQRKRLNPGCKLSAHF